MYAFYARSLAWVYAHRAHVSYARSLAWWPRIERMYASYARSLAWCTRVGRTYASYARFSCVGSAHRERIHVLCAASRVVSYVRPVYTDSTCQANTTRQAAHRTLCTRSMRGLWCAVGSMCHGDTTRDSAHRTRIHVLCASFCVASAHRSVHCVLCAALSRRVRA